MRVGGVARRCAHAALPLRLTVLDQVSVAGLRGYEGLCASGVRRHSTDGSDDPAKPTAKRSAAKKPPPKQIDFSSLYGYSTTVGPRPSNPNPGPPRSPTTHAAPAVATPAASPAASPVAAFGGLSTAVGTSAAAPSAAAVAYPQAPASDEWDASDTAPAAAPAALPSRGLARKATAAPGAPIPTTPLTGEERLRAGLQKGIDFEALGVGGADAQLAQIFRRVFASRSAPPELVRRLGVRHVKGLLLHGPPGTGKTLIARQLAKALNAPAPKVVNGPDIFQRFVGQSEENIRELFAPAERDAVKLGDHSPLHVVIFDEIDACMKVRSGAGNSGTGTVVHDNVVNQLLVKLDGVQRLNNVLVIGITNRPDMLDPALLRPGRLEVKVEVGLPDSSGREQILRILIRTMASHGAVADDVRLDAVAEATKNFSGAELEGLINSATSFALERSMRAQAAESSGGGGEGGEQQTGESEVRVQMQDFDRALREVLPALSTHTARLAAMAPHGMSARGEAFARLHTTASRMTRRLVRGGARAVWGAAAGPPGQVTAALLTGRGGVGKSAVAATIAAASGAPLVQVLGPEAVVGQEEREVVRAVREAFADVWKSPVAILILDDLERLIGFTEGSGEHHRGVLTALQTLLKQRPPDGHRLLVLGTTSLAAHSLRALQLAGDAGAFQLALEVPPLDAQETRGILEAHPAVATTEVGGVLRMLAVGAAGVPVKHLLMLLEMAHENSRQDAEDADVADAATVTLEHVAECLQHMRAAGLLLPA